MIAADVSYRSLKVWQRNRDVFLQLWKAELAWPLVEPVLIMLGLGLGLGAFVQLSGDESYIKFLAPGLMAVYPMFSAVAECAWGSYSRMATQRTFDAIIATPVSIEDVIAGEVLWAATRGLISAFYITVVALAMTPTFGIVESPLVVLVVPFAFFSGFMFGAMSLAATSLVRSISQLSYFFSIVVMPMYWLGGVFFPLSRLPEALRVAAWFLPIRHVVRINRALVSGELDAVLLVDLLWLAIAAAVFFRLALVSMRRRLIE